MATCFHCFCELKIPGPCPMCGYDPAADAGKYPLALPHGSVLAGQYTVGRVIGEDRCGYTYLALDRQLSARVAVREYCPPALALRRPGETAISLPDGERGELFRAGFDSFLERARLLARFRDNPGVAGARGFFEENGCGYLVTEYLESVTLEAFLHSRGGRLPWQEAAALLLPVLDTLCAVHREGALCLCAAPDTVFLAAGGGGTRLLSLGLPWDGGGETGASLSPGYAAPELYESPRSPGPPADVYAAAALLYTCVTGRRPPRAPDRRQDDELILPSAGGVRLPYGLGEAILRGMEVEAADRFRTMEEFRSAVQAAAPVSAGAPQPSGRQTVSGGPQPSQQPVSAGAPQPSGRQTVSGGPQSSQQPVSAGAPQTSGWQAVSGGPQPSQQPVSAGAPQAPYRPDPAWQAAPQPAAWQAAPTSQQPAAWFGLGRWSQWPKRDKKLFLFGGGVFSAVLLVIFLAVLIPVLSSTGGAASSVSDAVEAPGRRLTEEGSVDFQDPALGAMLRAVLGKEDGEEVLPEELAAITAFTAGSILDDEPNLIAVFEDGTQFEDFWEGTEPIRDVTDLGWLTGCTELSLAEQSVEDLSPLAELTRLEDLEVSYCMVRDASPLAGLTNLTSLSLWSNLITDIEPLSGLTRLTFLDLSDNQITDLTPLENLTQLQTLWLGENQIEDVTPLSGLVRLDSLFLNDNSITDLSPLAGLGKLETLFIRGNEIEDLSPVSHVNYVDILN